MNDFLTYTAFALALINTVFFFSVTAAVFAKNLGIIFRNVLFTTHVPNDQFRLHRAILQVTRLLVHIFLCRTATTNIPFCIHSMKLTYNQLPHLAPRVISHLNIVQISKLRLDFTNFYSFGFVTRMDNEITARFFNFHHCFI